MWPFNNIFNKFETLDERLKEINNSIKEIDIGITAIVAQNAKANKPKTFKKHSMKFMDDKHDERITERRKNS